MRWAQYSPSPNYHHPLPGLFVIVPPPEYCWVMDVHPACLSHSALDCQSENIACCSVCLPACFSLCVVFRLSSAQLLSSLLPLSQWFIEVLVVLKSIKLHSFISSPPRVKLVKRTVVVFLFEAVELPPLTLKIEVSLPVHALFISVYQTGVMYTSVSACRLRLDACE